jgi:hypothetical protein
LAIAYLLGNALLDPSSRGPTLAIFGVIAFGIPIYFMMVGRRGGRIQERDRE